MSGAGISSLGTATPQIRSAIAQAAQSTGVDFDFLLAQARIESSLDPQAQAKTSSASGLYQFTDATWLETLDRHGSRHGMAWASDAIAGGRITDPRLAGNIMALRHDPAASALMAGELARENGANLSAVLGRSPDASELYLGHFLGSGDAGKFLSALKSTPEISAASVLPRAASANRAIFYDGGSARSVGEVMGLIRAKVDGAMAGSGVPAPAAAPAAAPARITMAAPLPQAARGPSMAQSLASAFGSMDDAATPAAVQRAYRRLEGMGL
ncbi:transglycosylase SLT domain-containing protein [Croceicoccus mobilis]|uniref:Transglycosylase SLT domain-containing protein n=1 Tax=Croceicoccus mobilis TaxID=1703339 RepID=A0A917DRU9_9SPHN|nr:transglycosylase SLT domain-containing protein [Croceicoccus mobilis]GGD64072.1 hypothetical protein GCM10010990_11890 [Croceicoccus mobilis]